VNDLLVHPDGVRGVDGTILSVTPQSAGWRYVGFEVLELSGGVTARRECGDRELCAVVV
jgi:5-deoxy-glucuronate isomerase